MSTQHVHYDLNKIERGIRDLFASSRPDLIDENPEVVAAFRRSVDCEVAVTRFALSEMMRGTPPDILFTTLARVFTNLIMNRMEAFGANPGECSPLIGFVPLLMESLNDAYQSRLNDPASVNGIEVKPEISGTA